MRRPSSSPALPETEGGGTVDVWDGDLLEPIIYHGRTLTSKIPVSDALKAIAKYAFVASPYPVILSLEVHCDQPQQDVLAQLLQTCLGPALVDGRLNPDEDGTIEQLPSPEELKYRILVKVRPSLAAKGQVLMMEQAKNRFVEADKGKEARESSPEESTSESSTSSDSDLKRRWSLLLPSERVTDLTPQSCRTPAAGSRTSSSDYPPTAPRALPCPLPHRSRRADDERRAGR